ncbi:hypothetical protein FE633_32540 [Streptomyces montanus]|uniref:Uncharacterized protein n=1 Tax=Streptomyces montanus TaxID=2580423 RepID=A0A5R9FKM6_9ACTN|nr:hypothetical protein [Streptomyces montanus]TLS42108.1 hypothetical protein FE633_32540 [Streptomyces montanus]
MDQADAIIWATALGIGGTLAAGLTGPVLQARASRRQARDQEAFQVRHRLRDERRVAFATVLDQCEAFRQSINAVIEAHLDLEWRSEDAYWELWQSTDAALDALRRAATNVAITGPAPMGELTDAVHAAAARQAGVWRMRLDLDDRLVQNAQADSAFADARRQFIAAAEKILVPPTNQGSRHRGLLRRSR